MSELLHAIVMYEIQIHLVKMWVLPAPLKYRVSHVPCDFLTLYNLPVLCIWSCPCWHSWHCLSAQRTCAWPTESDKVLRGYLLSAQERQTKWAALKGSTSLLAKCIAHVSILTSPALNVHFILHWLYSLTICCLVRRVTVCSLPSSIKL